MGLQQTWNAAGNMRFAAYTKEQIANGMSHCNFTEALLYFFGCTTTLKVSSDGRSSARASGRALNTTFGKPLLV